MRHLLTSVFGLALVGLPAQAQDADIRRVIEAQISAFQQDDFGTAFGFASDTIRRLFGTPERFGQMVRDGYPMVYRPSELRFLGLQQTPAGPSQRVLMRDAAGAVHVLEYQMIDTQDGWKINGVRRLDASGLGA